MPSRHDPCQRRLHHGRLAFEALESRRLLTAVTVTNAFDVVNGVTTSIDALVAGNGGDGISLREAIQAANATPGADVIQFAPALGGQTILLGGTELAISEALSIEARSVAGGVGVNGNGDSRVFHITNATGSYLLAGLTIGNGRTVAPGTEGGGAGVRAAGSVTLEDCLISGNTVAGSGAGGGVFAGGALTLNHCQVTYNATSAPGAMGGGVFSNASVTLTRSRVSGNHTEGQLAYGGGVAVQGDATIIQSTISANSTTGSNNLGGGVFASGSIALDRSTISGNMVAGGSNGGGLAAASFTINQSTITLNKGTGGSSNGGGVYQLANSSGAITVTGSIVAGNQVTVSGLQNDVKRADAGTLTVNYSVTGSAVFPTAGANFIPTDDPGLGPLGFFGTSIPVHPVLPGSVALDAGDPSIAFNPAVGDQRGTPFARVFDGDGMGGARIDVGAFERQTLSDAALVVGTNSDVIDDDLGPGELSLREAIYLASLDGAAQRITFASEVGGQTITLQSGELMIGEGLTIDGGSMDAPVTIHGNNQTRLFRINATSRVTLAGLTLTGGRSSLIGFQSQGGAILSTGTGGLTLERCLVTGNSTTGAGAAGGAIYSTFGAVEINRSTISDNSTSGSSAGGGAIAIIGALTVTDSTISGNSTGGVGSPGGGILSSTYAGGVTLLRSTVSNNTAGAVNAPGGGIFSGGAPVSVTLSTISGNGSAGPGAGIRTYGPLTMVQSTVTANLSPAAGAGINLESPYANTTSTFTGCIISGNQSGVPAAKDIVKDFGGTLNISYCLLGVLAPLDNGVNNVFTDNPRLNPLADNGGPTQTHLPQLDSQAGDMGLVASSGCASAPAPSHRPRGVDRSETRDPVGSRQVAPARASQLVQ